MPRSRISIRSPTSPPAWERTSTSARSGAVGNRRAHQFHAVVARPFGGAGHVADLAAGAVDQQRRRHAEGLAGGFQVLEYARARVGIIGEPLDADLLEESERLLRIAGVDIDGDHVEVGAA